METSHIINALWSQARPNGLHFALIYLDAMGSHNVD